ncbi:transmembrane protein, putative [Bodo saltans]|uniref:Derlin n=1 Tax=Bodo saltans TaxID=75058 RepID=A0A0S4KDZ1_BODSA|nr:transmembrane protein, putative [Bodo saltans]|eukprot:CUI11064.1 transmembrane protein, putative [Bodo saltans]
MEVEQFVRSIPVITRTIIAASIVLSAAVTYEMVTPLNLIYSPTLVFQEKQYWRLLTSLLYFDKLSINCLFHLHFLYMVSRQLEEHYYLRDSIRYIWTLLRGAALVLLLASYLHIPFPSGPMVMVILYLWSRRYPDERMALYFAFVVGAPYLPLIMLFLSYNMSGGDIQYLQGELGAVVIGHCLWYVSDVLPKIIGFDPTALPTFVTAVFR